MTVTPLTGEPNAGNPPVRFGGRGRVQTAFPTPIPFLRITVVFYKGGTAATPSVVFFTRSEIIYFGVKPGVPARLRGVKGSHLDGLKGLRKMFVPVAENG